MALGTPTLINRQLSSTDGTSHVFSSWTPNDGVPTLVTVVQKAATTPGVPTLAGQTSTGWDTTWAQVFTVTANVGGQIRLTVFKGTPVSSTPGDLTATDGDTVTCLAWGLEAISVSGLDTTTPVVQHGEGVGTDTAVALDSPLSAFASGSYAYAIIFDAAGASGTVTWETTGGGGDIDWTALGSESNISSPTAGLESAYAAGEDTTPTATLSGSDDFIIVGMELGEAGAGGGNVVAIIMQMMGA